MALNKTQKKKILEDLRGKIARQKAIILVGISGLKVKDISELRKKLKGVEAGIQVVKKTLAELIFKENKLDFKKNQFKEEIALVFGFKDEILPAKAVYQFSKENENLKILGGFIENKSEEAEKFIALAKLPAREELLARLVGSIGAPLSGLVSVLEGNIKGLIRVLAKVKT
ncbi:MAG: 50S ribosomal protein L10 [bacterium]